MFSRKSFCSVMLGAFLALGIGVGVSTGVNAAHCEVKATDQLVASASFNATNNQSKCGNYTTSWKNITDGFSWDLENFNNNNNGWNYVKCGSKNAASVGKISTTNTVDAEVSKITVTIDKITAASVNSITVYGGEDGTTSLGTLAAETGTKEFTITAPEAKQKYAIAFDCKKASSNGVVQVSSVCLYTTIDAEMTEISVKTAPDKVRYEAGETFDPTGLVITAKYSDDSTEDIAYSAATASNFSFAPATADALNVTDTSVVISYNSLVTEQTITVYEASEIAIKTAPDTVNYNVGDYFDPTGLVITVTNSDGTTEEVTYSDQTASLFEFAPALTDALKATDTSVVIAYKDCLIEQAITVVQAGLNVNAITVGKGYELVTSASGLVAGDSYLLVCQSKGKVATEIASAVMGSADVAFNNVSGTIITNCPDTALVFTLGGEAGAWTLAKSTGELLGATAAKKLAWDSGTTTWAITYTDGVMTMANTTSSYGTMKYNASSPRFTTYTSGQTDVQLYHYSESLSVIKELRSSSELFTSVDTVMNTLDTECAAKAVSEETWASVQTALSSYLTDTTTNDYTILTSGVAVNGGNRIEDFLARYDIIVASYGYTNFLNRTISKSGMMDRVMDNNNTAVIIVSVIAISTLAVLGIYLVSKKRKEA